jgi:hypothetical protein
MKKSNRKISKTVKPKENIDTKSYIIAVRQIKELMSPPPKITDLFAFNIGL